MAKGAYVTVKGDMLIIETPYDEEFVSQLKEQTTTRKWDGHARVWSAAVKEKATVLNLVKRHFYKAYLIEGAIVCDLHTGECMEQAELF